MQLQDQPSASFRSISHFFPQQAIHIAWKGTSVHSIHKQNASMPPNDMHLVGAIALCGSALFESSMHTGTCHVPASLCDHGTVINAETLICCEQLRPSKCHYCISSAITTYHKINVRTFLCEFPSPPSAPILKQLCSSLMIEHLPDEKTSYTNRSKKRNTRSSCMRQFESHSLPLQWFMFMEWKEKREVLLFIQRVRKKVE